MISKKTRRHSGWTIPISTLEAPKQYIIDNCLDPQPFWNNWSSYNDGYGDFLSDRTKIKRVSFIKMWDSDINDYWDEYKQNWKKDRWKIMKKNSIRKVRKRKLYIVGSFKNR